MILLLVGLAGGVGCVVRYAMEYLLRSKHPTLRPWATVGANALGAFIAGYAAYRFWPTVTNGVENSHDHVRSLVLTGFCGGLTTFSSALAVPVLLAKEHHWKYSVAIVVATPLVCWFCFYLGSLIG